MTYQGYMALSNGEGETLELVNAARVKAYTDNLAPTIGLRGCDDCDGLPEALGETYVSPTTDSAPWYDPTDPATADFYGVYPLSFEGIDDSTRTIESAELAGDGSVVVGSRFAGQDIRVTGMAFAKDEAALYAGVSWLNSALNGTEDGRCFGDELNLYSSCPPVQALPPDFATPYTLVVPPSAEELSEWTTTSGTITSHAEGINFAWDAGDPSKIACRAFDLIVGEQYQLRMRLENFGDYYVSMGRACVERSTNMMHDPRLTTRGMSLNGATVADSHPFSGSADGGSYFSREMVTANTSSPMSMLLTEDISAGIPVVEGRSYTVSWYARKSIPGGPTVRVDWNWWTEAGDPVVGGTGTEQDPTGEWARFTQTDVVPATAAWGQPVLSWVGTGLIGQVLDLGQVMVNVGSTALDYFDGNYPGARWQGVANDSQSFLVENSDYQTISGWTGNHPSDPVVLDFVARAETMCLSIQPTDTSPYVPTMALRVMDASIRRVAKPGVLAFGSGTTIVPPSDGWTHLAPATAEVTWITGQAVEYHTVRTDMRAPFGSALTYTTAHGIVRTVFGMTPGERYRLLIEFGEGWAPTDSDPLETLNPIVVIPNSSDAVVTYANDAGLTHYWSIEFTATATSTELGLHPNAPLALGSFGQVTWDINQFMVEEILDTDTSEPRPGRFQERTMYQVKASQGPLLTNVRRAPCGVMGQITYALRAGQPFKYRSPIFAGGLPAGTSQTIGDIPCSADGLAQVVNFAYNPSLETNATDWAASGSNMTFDGRVASPTAIVGDYVYRATANASGIVSWLTSYYFVSSTTGGPIPQAGEQITVSRYVRAIALAWTGLHTWDMFVTMDGFDPITFSGTVNVDQPNVWYRVSHTFFLPDNVSLEGIEFRIIAPEFITSGGGMESDGLMIQRGPVATEPFDETTPGASWSDGANTSALLLDPMAEDISADPDCPAPPIPPGPPEIVNSCVTSPASYNRTVVQIPADTVPRNLSAFPIITMTAGTTAVRQARIRFWENPDDLLIENLEQCSFDGEIIVSYLAPGATLVIDGVLREATASAPGVPSVNANHVLYGPDGGPVDWPVLSGGVPYLVTLDLDSDEPYGDTLLTVDLVVRD